MIQPISGFSYKTLNKPIFKSKKIPFVGFYDPSCVSYRGPAPKDTFGVIADFTKETAEKFKTLFVSKKIRQMTPDSPVLAGLNRFKETYMPEIANMNNLTSKFGVKLLDDRNIFDNESGVLTHILPDGVTTVTINNTETVQANSSIVDKVKSKLQEKFGLDIEKVPEWADPSCRYLTDSNGKILFSNVTNEPYINPWYNPDSISETISAVSSLSRPSMSEFIAHAAEASSDSAISAFAGVTDYFENAGIKLNTILEDTNSGTVDDSAIDMLADAVKNFFDFLSDAI